MIYGDTDSIMIYTGLDDIAKAKAIAGKVIQEVGLIISQHLLENHLKEMGVSFFPVIGRKHDMSHMSRVNVKGP